MSNGNPLRNFFFNTGNSPVLSRVDHSFDFLGGLGGGGGGGGGSFLSKIHFFTLSVRVKSLSGQEISVKKEIVHF
jgi:hypothetical protein